jgi:hypothetical protein
MPASYQLCLCIVISKLDSPTDFFRSLFRRAAEAATRARFSGCDDRGRLPSYFHSGGIAEATP